MTSRLLDELKAIDDTPRQFKTAQDYKDAERLSCLLSLPDDDLEKIECPNCGNTNPEDFSRDDEWLKCLKCGEVFEP